MSDLISIGKPNTNFFVTGNEYIRDNLDLKFIPRGNLCEDKINEERVILAAYNQNLQQSFNVAKDFFAHSESGTIKFVLIGLTPYNFSANDKEPPVAQPIEENVLADYFKLCVDNSAKPVCVVLPVNAAVKKTYNADVLKAFRDTVNKIVKKHKATFVDLLEVKLSTNLFKDKAHLNEEGKMAVTALLSKRLYLDKVISAGDILDMGNEYFNVLSEYFSNDYTTLIHHIFCRMACDDFNYLSETLSKNECKDLMANVFSKMTYDHLAILSNMLPKDDYNDLSARIFAISVEKIRQKDKIKIGFVLYDSSTWCGNDLYNFFSQDEHFEPTVFLCLRVDGYKKNHFVREEFSRQTEQLKSNGLNVVALDRVDSTISRQDLVFYLIPYAQRLPRPFQLMNIDARTLLAYIPYSFEVGGKYDASFTAIVRVAWKQFFPSQFTVEMYNKKAIIGILQRIYSGYPKVDAFFRKDINFRFDWKMIRPDAKKIIWAPHHSIGKWSIQTATFQWNYKFMYEFAKAHPEISWVVKPHSNLPVNSIVAKIFPNSIAFEEYMQKWDSLPNAQVYTGAYYQALFATSDGLIHDCGSFTVEYQYIDKPMIYLTRDTQKFNELGEEILKASYTVDGQDLEGIAAMIQRVIIEGDDYKAAERKAVFDKYLNYPKANGMLASEFIYKNIADELKAPT